MKGKKTGGRQKGTPNKLTSLARQAIEQAAEGLGGAERLEKWVRGDPTINLFPKLLPLQVTCKDEEPLISPTDSERAEALLAFMDKLSGKR